MGQVLSWLLYPIVVASLQVWRWAMIRDEHGNFLPNHHISMTFDYPQILGHGDFVPDNGNMTMVSLDPDLGLAKIKWEGTNLYGTASGFHHFDFDGTHLRYTQDRHGWTPNGTFQGRLPGSKRGVREVIKFGGTWTLIQPDEAEAFTADAMAMAAVEQL